MDGTQLASALAERVAQVLPEGFSISSDGHELWLNTPDGYGNSAWTGGVDENPMDFSSYAGAAWVVLNSIQDGVSITLREPWPLMMVGRQHLMAIPGLRSSMARWSCGTATRTRQPFGFPPIKLGDRWLHATMPRAYLQLGQT